MPTAAPVPKQAQATASPRPAAPRLRVDSVDLLRGLAMVLMALDHVRIFFHDQAAATSMGRLAELSAPHFFTRWIPHFCAPVFFFLAGTGARLALLNGKTPRSLAKFLFTRGLWLLVLELTWVQFSWDFHWRYEHFTVIGALAVSMMALAGLALLPPAAVGFLGLAVILGHNALDGITSDRFGSWGWLWLFTHQLGRWQVAPGYSIVVNYPLLAWAGIMAAGYGFGGLWRLDGRRRRQVLWALGLAATAAFVALRYHNGYGDPDRWAAQSSPLYTVLSFLNCRKYPPSLAFILMTLGPAILLLAWWDRGIPFPLRPLLAFGRAPLFYYILHIPLIHGLALLFAWERYGAIPWREQVLRPPGFPFVAPEGYGYGLPAVYALWALAVVILFPACAWFARMKGRKRSVLLSYL
jgi:uncharacterized membrane protein